MSQDDSYSGTLVAQQVCQQCASVSPARYRFCGYCGASLTGSPRQPRQTPERRQLTVLFCDLIESTRIAANLDPEDFREVALSFQSVCTEIINRFGGTVSRYMGDGILALFGYPAANEDDAESATRAGLAIADAIPAIRVPGAMFSEECLAVRVGIATGLVVVGDIIGEGASKEEAVVGETPNVAARLQSNAAPNSLLISETTRVLLGNRFDCGEPVSLTLRGYAQPFRAYPVRAAANVVAQRLTIFTPIVNRGKECASLESYWHQATLGRGGAVLLFGEAGIGKSRVVSELYVRIRAKPHWLLRYQCSSYYSNTALHPVSEQVALASGIGSEDPPEQKLNKIERWLRTATDTVESLALMAALMSIPSPHDSLLSAMSAERRKERTFDLLMQMAQRQAAGRPLLVVFEDVHWADPTTRELLGLIVRRAAQMSALVLMTARPGFEPPWTDADGVQSLELQHFGPAEAVQLVGNLAGEVRILDANMEQMIARADGIPLFIEELTKALLAGERSIPATLQDSLMARLDRLGQAKQIAQIAGVLGREFAPDLLAAVADMARNELQSGLRALEDAGLVRALSGTRAGAYEFKHALIQEAAYQTLLHRRRRELHKRIAEVLQAQFPGKARDAPELLAYHWTEADEPDRATLAWLTAGKRASERSQYREAIAHLRNGLALVEELGDPDLQRERELELRLALGPAIITTEGGGAPEVSASYARTLELCEGQPPSAAQFAAGWGWWRASMDLRTGRKRADDLLRLAESLGERDLILQAHHCQWATLYMLGALQECCIHIATGLSMYDADRHHPQAVIYGGHDVRVCGLGELAVARWLMGLPDEAVEHAKSALGAAEAMSHVGSRVHAMDYALVLYKFRRDASAVAVQARDLVVYAADQKLRDHHAKGIFFQGWARAILDNPEMGLREMLQAMAAFKDVGTPEDISVYYEMVAEVCGRLGCHDQGLRAIEDAFEQTRRCGISFWNAELHRRRGELLAASGVSGAKVGDCFQQALDCARSQGALGLELRAALSLARFSHAQGDLTSASAMLRAVYTRFCEGFDTPDLIEAKQFLDDCP
jgi:predicted ATPase/class 3 adenylate cyclase